MRRHLVGALVAAVIFALLPMLGAQPAAAATATFRAGLFDIVVAGGLGGPTAVAMLPDGRSLVTSQGGTLWLVGTNGTKSVALDLAALSKVCSDGEEGLLGVTPDPLFALNGFVYVFYTARVGSCALNGASPGGAKNRVSRFTMTGSSVDPATEAILLDNMPEWGGNHNGGEVRVANDGTMFVSVGDGGGGSPASNPSDLSLPNGKVLRINRDGTPVVGNPHGTTPCKNAWGPPGAPKVCGEIWADGLRNPFRLGFDVSAPGAKFRINDVGAGSWEEVDDAFAGAHYGWPCREGPDQHSTASCATPFTNPVLFYNHSTGCNVETGGAFVPPGVWPGFDGAYLWVDLGCGQLFLAQPGQTGTPPSVFATGLQGTTDLEFLPVAGGYSLFYTTYANGGELHRVLGSPTPSDRWEGLGGVTSDTPAVASWSAGRLDVFVRGADNQLWHKWWANGWSGWEPLGGVLTSGPAAVAWSVGRLDVFVKGPDNQLWHKRYQGGWSGWEPLGGVLGNGPAVASWSAGRLDVFVRGADNQLWHKWWANGWSGWEPLGGVLTSGPAAVAWSVGRIDVFVKGAHNQLWHKWYQGGWSGWEPLGGVLNDTPAVASGSTGRLDVFVRGGDNKLWHRWWANGWSGWEPLGGVLASGPAAEAWSIGRFDVFVRGNDNQLWHKWYDGTWN